MIRALPRGGALVAALGLLLGVAAAVQPKLALVGLGGLGVAVLGVMYPVSLVGMMFLGVLVDRIGLTGMTVSGFPITASKLSVLGSLGLWVVHVGLGDAPPARWHPVLGSMLGIVGGTAISVAIANSMAEGKFDLYGLAMMTVLVGLVYAILAEVPLAPLYRFLTCALLGACLASLRGGGDRATGTMGDPNEWGTMVLLLTPVMLGGLADDDHWSAAPLRLALLLLAPLAILRTESRTALVVGFLVTAGCVYVLRRRRTELALCVGGAVVAAPMVISVSDATARFWKLVGNLQGGAVQQDESLEERSELFRQGKQLFFDHWLLGVGPGNFARSTGFVSHTGELRPAHNTYLEVASEQGVLGLIPFAIFFGTVAWTLRDAAQGARTSAQRNRVLGMSIGLGSFALMSATLGLLTFSMAYLVLGLGLAVATQARGPHVG